jgi:preprotein translocase subunit SecE
MTKIRKFFSEISLELQKTTWPWNPKETGFKKYKELVDSTIVVIVAMIFLGAFVALWDTVMLAVMRVLTGTR